MPQEEQIERFKQYDTDVLKKYHAELQLLLDYGKKWNLFELNPGSERMYMYLEAICSLGFLVHRLVTEKGLEEAKKTLAEIDKDTIETLYEVNQF